MSRLTARTAKVSGADSIANASQYQSHIVAAVTFCRKASRAERTKSFLFRNDLVR